MAAIKIARLTLRFVKINTKSIHGKLSDNTNPTSWNVAILFQ